MASLKENIQQAISDFDNIKAALEENDIEIPKGTDTKEYADKIRLLAKQSGIDTKKMTDFSLFFQSDHNIDVLPYIDTRNGTIFNGMFKGSTITDTPDLDTSKGTDFTEMFLNCSKLTKAQISTDNAITISGMFQGCTSLKSQSINAQNATDLNYAFSGCSSLESVDLNSTENGQNFRGIFFMCGSLKEIKGLNLSNATSAYEAFSHTSDFTPDVMDISNLTNANMMFMNSQVKQLNFNMTKNPIIDVRFMFSNCYYLTDLHGLDFSNAKDGNYMQTFYHCGALTNVTFKGIKITSYGIDFSYSPKLTVESLVNILNALSDNSGLSATYTVKLGTTNLAKLSQEQKDIATNKNIKLA